jgi:acyl-coenzyme A synthetase/AMP-(fatty) acid ligase
LDRVTRALSTRGTFGRFRVAQVPAIPRTSTGKIQRHLLRRTAERLAR